MSTEQNNQSAQQEAMKTQFPGHTDKQSMDALRGGPASPEAPKEAPTPTPSTEATPDMSWQHLANTRALQLDSVTAQLATAKEERATVAPSERAASATREIVHQYSEQLKDCLHPSEIIAAIIQRTCFPPGEGEEWAKALAKELASQPSGPYFEQAAFNTILKHAPTHPAPTKESGDVKDMIIRAATECAALTTLPGHYQPQFQSIISAHLLVSESERLGLYEFMSEAAKISTPFQTLEEELKRANEALSFAETAVTCCHSAMLGKVHPKHPAWAAVFAVQDAATKRIKNTQKS